MRLRKVVAPGVEDDREVGADMVLQQAGQHVGEAEDGVDRGAVGPGHRRQGVEGAEDEARAVDQTRCMGGSPVAQWPVSAGAGFSTNTREQ